ncbi:MAG: glycosyltransferase family 4 protein [Paracoccaceae bacterium]|nr:glycosyltransferase family 4 protein [Paracoccaceae bacterium]
MTSIRVIHLVDDTTPGGVMRMLDHLMSLPGLLGRTHQSVCLVKKSEWSIGRHDADVIVSHLALSWRSLPALMALRAMNPDTRVLHVEHSYTRAFTALNVPNKKRFHTMLRTSYALFDGVIAVSKGQAEWLLQRNLVTDRALSVIRPHVDLSQFEAIAPPEPTRNVIGAFGRLEPQKGFDILIEAFHLCPLRDARLVIFGEGSERARLGALARYDNRISFRGHCTDLPSAYAETNIVAMPSRWEAFGLVAQEAQAAGRNVLVSGVDGLAEQAGGLIHLQSDLSPDAWAKRLHTLLITPAVANAQTRFPACGIQQGNLSEDWLREFCGPVRDRNDVLAAVE